MGWRVSNLKMGLDEPEAALADRVAQALGVAPRDVRQLRILRKSLDTRDKRDIHFVYSAAVDLPGDLAGRAIPQLRGVRWERFSETPFRVPRPGNEPLPHRPIVVGSGPAGLFAAYLLAAMGYAPLVLERGRPVNDRIRDVRAFDAGGPHLPESNYLFGEGGAGTFSDGKLTCRATGPDVRKVLEILAASKGKPTVVYDQRPHLGSNRLPAVVKDLRRKIISAGGVFQFECRLDGLDVRDGRVHALATSSGQLPTSVVVLAIGHSARDTYEMLHQAGVPMLPKPFQIGLRIEHAQDQVNRAQYGSSPLEERLGAADYSLVARGPPDVFTFCMCAGGYIMPSVSEPGHFCTNGMSLSGRASPFANSGLMVTLQPAHFGGEHPLAGMMLQRRYESSAFVLGRAEYCCPIQRGGDFVQGRPSSGYCHSSYPRPTTWAALLDVVPPVVGSALLSSLPILDRRWRGKFLHDSTLVGPESRGSAPVRFLRDPQSLESTGVCGLYPVGEGAGYAGGIVSAALDGLRAAKAIIARHAPLEDEHPELLAGATHAAEM